ncbi:MAG: succinylglutamate desuccinylase/aspartoacylase family protein [Candidatus Eremiobacteraeota bacterium]|nr:succinylglutamate desuccinylase/aspartoacylase family protein [Candidatus Eremiobacteraeota bacterium]
MRPKVEHRYEQLLQRWQRLRRAGVVVLREVACVGAARTLFVAEAGPPAAPAVVLSAGVHGDEPAAPWALLDVAESGLLDPRFHVRMWICTNPSGYCNGTRVNVDGNDVNRSFHSGGTTPESAAIVTATRDRRFVLSLDLHEDPEGRGFYCYEPQHGGTPIAPDVVRAMDVAGLPVAILHEEYEIGYPPRAGHLRTLHRGHVDVHSEAARSHFARALPYTMFISRKHAERAMTFESPMLRDWATRIAVHRVAVTSAIATLAKSSVSRERRGAAWPSAIV